MRLTNIGIATLLICACSYFSLFAQKADYSAAQKYDAPNLAKKVGTLKIIPFFLKKTNRFWFLAEEAISPVAGLDIESNTGDERRLRTYYVVDLKTGSRSELFDKVAIANALKKVAPGSFNEQQIAYQPDFSKDEQTVLVKYGTKTYNYNYVTKELTPRPYLSQRINYPMVGASPDGRYEVYTRAHNLYLANAGSKANELQLTVDAEPYYSFCVDEKGEYNKDKSVPSIAKWINARYFYALRTDRRKVQTLAVINSGFMPRPLVSTYKEELPGDKFVAQYELFIGDTQTRTLKKIALDRWPDQQLEVIPAPNSNEDLYVLRRKRTRDEMELCAVNLNNGIVRTIIHETSKPFINEDMFNVSIIKAGKEILWWSDRSGWGQYYRYNSKGELLNRITKGDFTAGKIIGIDTVKSCAYLYAYGKQPNVNPYYAYVYKVDLNGKNEHLLTPENATHSVFISPDKKFLIDSYSSIDVPPVTKLRTTEGKEVAEVYKTNASALYAYGWKHPEPFTVKAKDGVTDLYGLMWKPFNFDPNKKYPVISQVYPGPQIETVWPDFTVLDKYNNTSLAQMGFIVVCVGHRGGSPLRNAAYYKYGHGNLRDYAIDDDKYALEQLGRKYAYMDMSKVGMFGHSGGGMMTVAAMCKYPDFYKVGVASSGNHDNRIYHRAWGETYQGFDIKMPLNQDLAKNLNGHLMLVTGEVDENVNPANTYRMVDALIKADKDFDLLVLPGQNHTYEGQAKAYFQKRLRAYFAKYLMED
ncbi:S9 family peptidase [Mucilaginibacter terrae]|uniref:Dipeptidyl-peptidase-4 n=1 Tax=Mucilaginibacter terrae TaxID=1955052 RepID=A0ABU3GRZ6_9SPHI|nr:prolyl oligopeptidase family serine peptidase [Mucilaginibacter terrae]MDT3402246.1 dipeptidyl-peptidase-4 [Mucilaginibacter terrae]